MLKYANGRHFAVVHDIVSFGVLVVEIVIPVESVPLIQLYDIDIAVEDAVSVVAPTTLVNENDVVVAVAGVHVNVNTVPVDPVKLPIVPLEADVNATVGRVVESVNVAVIVDVPTVVPVPVSATVCCARDVLDAMNMPDVIPWTLVKMNDVERTLAGVHVNVNVVPVDPVNAPTVPLGKDVNPTVGSVVESTNVPVIVDAYPTYPVPVSVNPCSATAVLEDARDATPTTFVNVKDVDVAVAGVHKNVNAVPVDPDNEPMVPLDADVNATVGSVVVSTNVAVIVDA